MTLTNPTDGHCDGWDPGQQFKSMAWIKAFAFLTVAFLGLICTFTQAQSVTTTCQTGKYPPDPKTKVGTYTINLDLPPEQRWTELAKAKAPQIKTLLNGFKDFVKDFGAAAQYLIDFIDNQGGDLDGTLPYPFAGELKGISAATGLNLGEVVLYNLFYEFFTVCTSIVAEDPSGKLYHARNLDFGLFIGWDIQNRTWAITERLRPLIVNLDWQRGGKTVFKSVNYAGFTGILTAVKQNQFTFTMNERFNIDGGFIGIVKWLLGNHNQTWMGFLTRDVMENATSFAEAQIKLQKTVMLAPAYFILGGTKPGQASVITRSREAAVDTWPMRNASGWYILETNYDHWEAPLFLDDRRTPAHQCMDKMTQQNVGFGGLFNVLSSEPMLNKLTTYTALMQVDNGALETYIQDCKDPCTPW
ncbi:acid ceramidase [Plakobranchus ocellatus]|uniref:Acid ceramidase n=1 Tax=Plakobranchus ocellatus TaxID=259542 RepID=A0AAV3Y8A7_9GAST|nr:acid ceramidase [Plakobranchus ocellatus]